MHVLAIVQVDCVDELGDRLRCRVVQPQGLDHGLEGAEPAGVGEGSALT